MDQRSVWLLSVGVLLIAGLIRPGGTQEPDVDKPQGKRILSPLQPKDLRQVIGIPACHPTPHCDTFFVGDLLQ